MPQAIEMASAITQTRQQTLAAVTSMTPPVSQRLKMQRTLPGIALQASLSASAMTSWRLRALAVRSALSPMSSQALDTGAAVSRMPER